MLVHSRELAQHLDRERVLGFAGRLLKLGLVTSLLLYAKHSAPRIYYTLAKYFYLYKTAQLQFQLNRVTARRRVNALLEAQDWNGFAEPKGFRALSFLLSEVASKRSSELREQVAYVNFALLRTLALFTLTQLFHLDWLPVALAPLLVSVRERERFHQSIVTASLAALLWILGCAPLTLAIVASFGRLLLYNAVSEQLGASLWKRVRKASKFALLPQQLRLVALIAYVSLLMAIVQDAMVLALTLAYVLSVNLRAGVGMALMIGVAQLSHFSPVHLLGCAGTLTAALLTHGYMTESASAPMAFGEPRIKRWVVQPSVVEEWSPAQKPSAPSAPLINTTDYRPKLIENYELYH